MPHIRIGELEDQVPNATGPCKVSQQILAEQVAKDFEKLVLGRFLTEDKSMGETIDNLHQLLEHVKPINHLFSHSALFNARRALVSLEHLTNIIVGKV